MSTSRFLRPLHWLGEHHPEWRYIVGFAMAGGVSLIVNLSCLTIARWCGADPYTAIAVGLLASVVSSFLLNRQFTFGRRGKRPIWRQFAGFVGTSAVGIVVNYGVAIALVTIFHTVSPQWPAMGGMFVGTILNYLASRWLIFRPRPGPT